MADYSELNDEPYEVTHWPIIEQYVLRQREGDQKLPTSGKINVSEEVKKDLDERIKLGMKRYGTPLQTFNGRDSLQDAYEECLDLCHYLKQVILERDSNVSK